MRTTKYFCKFFSVYRKKPILVADRGLIPPPSMGQFATNKYFLTPSEKWVLILVTDYRFHSHKKKSLNLRPFENILNTLTSNCINPEELKKINE